MSYIKGEIIYDNLYSDDDASTFRLPHSCESWVIGNAEDARQLITDIEEILNRPPLPTDTEEAEK